MLFVSTHFYQYDVENKIIFIILCDLNAYLSKTYCWRFSSFILWWWWGERISTCLQANRSYKRLHRAIRGLQIDSLSTIYACASPGKPSNPSRGRCGRVWRQLCSISDRARSRLDTSTSNLVHFPFFYVVSQNCVDFQNYL